MTVSCKSPGGRTDVLLLWTTDHQPAPKPPLKVQPDNILLREGESFLGRTFSEWWDDAEYAEREFLPEGMQ